MDYFIEDYLIAPGNNNIISQNYYKLRMDKNLSIGRHSSKDMVILEETVSRNHAEIQFDPKKGFP